MFNNKINILLIALLLPIISINESSKISSSQSSHNHSTVLKTFKKNESTLAAVAEYDPWIKKGSYFVRVMNFAIETGCYIIQMNDKKHTDKLKLQGTLLGVDHGISYLNQVVDFVLQLYSGYCIFVKEDNNTETTSIMDILQSTGEAKSSKVMSYFQNLGHDILVQGILPYAISSAPYTDNFVSKSFGIDTITSEKKANPSKYYLTSTISRDNDISKKVGEEKGEVMKWDLSHKVNIKMSQELQDALAFCKDVFDIKTELDQLKTITTASSGDNVDYAKVKFADLYKDNDVDGNWDEINITSKDNKKDDNVRQIVNSLPLISETSSHGIELKKVYEEVKNKPLFGDKKIFNGVDTVGKLAEKYSKLIKLEKMISDLNAKAPVTPTSAPAQSAQTSGTTTTAPFSLEKFIDECPIYLADKGAKNIWQLTKNKNNNSKDELTIQDITTDFLNIQKVLNDIEITDINFADFKTTSNLSKPNFSIADFYTLKEGESSTKTQVVKDGEIQVLIKPQKELQEFKMPLKLKNYQTQVETTIDVLSKIESLNSFFISIYSAVKAFLVYQAANK